MHNRYLTINSIDRQSYETPSDFSINIKGGLKYQTARLILAQIPNTYYNITSFNNKIIINGSTKSMTPGNYNLTEFFTEFATNLDPSITGVTFNDTTGIVNFTLSSSLSVSFPSSGSMHSVLGFPSDYNTTANSHNSTFPPALGKHLLYINISDFASNVTSSYHQHGGSTFIVANNVNKNDIIMYNERTNFKQQINCRNIDELIYTLYIRVTDQFGNTCQQLSEWSCVISFY